MEKLYFKDGKENIAVWRIRDEFPNMSLPVELDDEFIRSLGYYPQEDVSRPIETETQYVVPDKKIVDGKYVRGWKFVDKEPEVIEFQGKHKKKSNEAKSVANDPDVKQFMSTELKDLDAFVASMTTEEMVLLLSKMMLAVARKNYE